ncbi:MAG: DMT family transporter [Clostridiales bacterium]|jgi:transporter family-2 protein|nr:DMT family transporter [Clostridiales bacterium]
MYYLLSLLTGILVSVMIVSNGGLTAGYGVYTATVIIHITGLLLITALMLLKGERPKHKIQNWVFYTGGAVGVATTVFNNFAYGRISVSAILALGLFGQTIFGLFIDQYGLIGMSKHPFRKEKIAGVLLIFAGIVSMITEFAFLAVGAAFLSGIFTIVSRTTNARLSDATTLRVSTFYNYVIGLLTAVPVLLLFGRGELPFAGVNASVNPFYYFGGVLGACIVLLGNMTVTKISAFYLSILLFVGQVFSGILIDALLSGAFSVRNLIGGMLVTLGLCVNLFLDRKKHAAVSPNATEAR